MTHRCFKTWWAILTGLFACVVGAQAYDFEKDGIYYNVTSQDDLTETSAKLRQKALVIS